MGHVGSQALASLAGCLMATAIAVPAGAGAASPAAAMAAADEPVPTVVGFDQYPANRSGTGAAPPITDQFAGEGLVFVDGVTALRFSDESIPAAPFLARSGEVVVTSCYAQEFCTNRIRMSFTAPLTRVAAYVGSSAELGSPSDVLLAAFDADGTPVGDDTVALPPGGLVPARDLLAVEDPSGRIRSAEVRWADVRSGLSSLIVDDVSLTPFVALRELAADPQQLALTVRDPTGTDVTITNTGNVEFPGLLAAFRPEAADPDPATLVDIGQDGCELGLRPGETCTVSLTATPLRPGTTRGAIELSVSIPRITEVARPVLQVPLTLTVPAPAPPRTRSDPPTRAGTSPPAESPTSRSAVTQDVEPTTTASANPWVPVLVVLVAVAALGMLVGPVVVRRLAGRGAPSSPTPPTDGPHLRARAGPRHDAVSGPGGPVLTLVAAAPPPVTRVTEDPR
jgi:hypothetical protein